MEPTFPSSLVALICAGLRFSGYFLNQLTKLAEHGLIDFKGTRGILCCLFCHVLEAFTLHTRQAGILQESCLSLAGEGPCGSDDF